MNGERAVLFATDPPYLVGYDGTNHPGTKASEKRASLNTDWSGTYGTTWDEADAAQNSDLYDRFIKVAVDVAILPNAAWYCWHASRRQRMVEEAWEKNGAFVHQQIIWSKPNRPDPDALLVPLVARAVLLRLAEGEEAAEGDRRLRAHGLGDRHDLERRAPGPPDTEAPRLLRDPDAAAHEGRRPLLRAVQREREPDHRGRARRPARLRDRDLAGVRGRDPRAVGRRRPERAVDAESASRQRPVRPSAARSGRARTC